MVVETGPYDWSHVRLDSTYQWVDRVFFPPLAKKLASERIPVILADPTISVTTAVIPDLAVLGGETVIGTLMLTRAAKKARHKSISRRDFLKGMLGTYLSLPAASVFGRVISSHAEVGHDATAKLKNISHSVHPESLIFMETLRNVVIAQKVEWLMKHYYSGHPHIATVLGAAHSEIEKEIMVSSEDRLTFLKNLQPVLKKVIAGPETFYKIALLDFDREWKASRVLEVPELRELIL